MRWGMVMFLLVAVISGAVEAGEKRWIRVYFPNGESVRAEPAISGPERERGLMFRPTLERDRGMLFFMGVEGIHPFWMKNVSFPIDILWLDREKRIVHMARNVPPCRTDPCPTYPPLMPSLYVLELAAGRADELGLRLHDQLEFTVPRMDDGRGSR
ncbi:MAG: DUF192 domain-containing protein [Thermodesulfobacteriota bacterium]